MSKRRARPSQQPPAPRARVTRVSRNLYLSVCVLLILAAAVLRIRAAQNDLWLDEIWSLNLAHSISSPLGVLTSIHHDNNHYLNTLYLYLLPNYGNWWGYRILSITAGIGTVTLAGLIGNRRSQMDALVLMFLTAFSYFLVLYSSEARGYSLLTFFVLLSFFVLERFVEKPSPWLAAGFSLSVILGVLSHLTFLPFYLATFVWSAYRLWSQKTSIQRFAVAMLSCHALPIVFLAFLYRIDVRFQVTGGGSAQSSVIEGFGQALAWACGAFVGNGAALMLCIAVIAALGFFCYKKADSSTLLVSGSIVAPLVFALAYNPGFVYVRYFIISMIFLLVLASPLLTSFLHRGGGWRAIAILLLASYLAANGWHIRTLFTFGRGQYSEAIRYMRENTRGPVITVGGDHPFRIPTTLSFFESQGKNTKELRYLNPQEWPPEGPEWVILHKESFDEPVPLSSDINDAAGHRYLLAKIYRTAPLSGLHWFVFHRASLPAVKKIDR